MAVDRTGGISASGTIVCGRFVPGPIHVELEVNGFEPNGYVIVDGVPAPITVDVGIPPLAVDLRAQRA